MQLGFQCFAWREYRQVFRDVNPALAQFKQLDLFLLFSGSGAAAVRSSPVRTRPSACWRARRPTAARTRGAPLPELPHERAARPASTASRAPRSPTRPRARALAISVLTSSNRALGNNCFMDEVWCGCPSLHKRARYRKRGPDGTTTVLRCRFSPHCGENSQLPPGTRSAHGNRAR